MSALTSLLARDQAVPVRKIEEALQKQVVSGGDIATVLLELEAIAENTLAAYQAALSAVLPATRDEVMKVPRDTVRLVPREVAEKHRIVPLAVDGRALLVATAAPLTPDVESQLGFLLGYELVARIVCEVRIAAGLQHHYGVEPSARHRRLIEKLRHREAGEIPYVAPPQQGKVSKGALGELPTKPRMSAASWLDEEEDEPPAPPPPRKSQLPPSGEGRTTDPNGFPSRRPPSMAGAPASVAPPAPSVPAPAARPASVAPPPAPSSVADPSFDTSLDLGEHAPRTTTPGLAPPGASKMAAPRIEGAVPAPVLGVGVRRSSHPPPRVPEPETRAAAPRPSAGPQPPEAPEPSRTHSSPGTPLAELRRLRGPLTAGAAARLLDSATGRDDVLAIFFAFARQFFDFAALFVVNGDVAEGRDAFGPGASADDVRHLAVRLDVPGRFAIVRRLREPTLEPMNTSDADREVTRDLRRPANVMALLVPVALRERAVLIFYGDRDGDSFALSDVPELVAFVPRIALALERIILQRKKSSKSDFAKSPSAPPERSDLKAAARSVGALPAARPARSPDRWSAPPGADRPRTERSSAPPPSDAIAPRSLVDAIIAAPNVPESTPPPPREEGSREAALPPPPTAASSSLPPAPDVAAVVRAPGRAAALRQMVGIPRSAPPPPQSDALDLGIGIPLASPTGFAGAKSPKSVPRTAVEPAVALPTPIGVGRDTMPESLLPIQGRSTEPAPPPSEEDDGPEMVVGTVEEGELDDFDTSGEYENDPAGDEASADDVDASASAKQSASGDRHAHAREPYLYKEASVDVVAGPKRAASGRPGARAPASESGSGREPAHRRRADPRREDEEIPITIEEKVRIPTGSYVRGGAAPRTEKITASHRPGRAAASIPPQATQRSVIVDMGDNVNDLVVELMHAGPDGEKAIVDALLRLGDAPLPSLAQAFPGPLWFDRRRPHRKQPRGRDVSAIARALFAYRERAVPYLATILGSGDTEHRFYATMLANELVAGGLVEPLAARVFDDDEPTRKLAAEALLKHRGLPEMVESLTVLRRTARIRGKDPQKRLRAIAALGAIRDSGALRLLVDLLEDEDGAVVHGAHLALVEITCEDLGAGARKWSAWADRNEARHRIEWLIDALTHGDETLRAAAGEDLKAMTQQYFGFHPGAGKKDREVVQQKYRTWWETQGRAIHAAR